MPCGMPLFQILFTDYVASLGAIIPLAIWGVTIVTRFFDPGLFSFVLPIAPVVTVAGLALALWRVWTIHSVLTDGTEVPGVISGAAFFRGRPLARIGLDRSDAGTDPMFPVSHPLCLFPILKGLCRLLASPLDSKRFRRYDVAIVGLVLQPKHPPRLPELQTGPGTSRPFWCVIPNPLGPETQIDRS